MDFSPQSTSTSVSFSTSHTMSVADDMKTQHRQFFNPVTPDVSPPHSSASGLHPGNTGQSQDALNFTAVTSSDIQEMEHVREHLQAMLKNARGFLENEDFDATQSNTTEQESQENREDTESVTSIETAALLRKLLPNSSPLSEMQVHFADQSTLTSSHSSSSQRMFLGEKKTRNNSNSSAGERTLMTENSLLREHLERERFRRKLLELQQQLAIAVSSERKKDVMVEQLDKTLAKVVEGWKKHESEKITAINELKREKETSEQSQQRQQEMLLQFEKELSQAVEALTKEQERAAQAENEKHTQLQQQQKEKEKLLEFLAKEKDRAKKAQEDVLKISREKEEVQQKLTEMQHNSEEHARIKTELHSKLESLEQEFKNALGKEKEKLDQEKQSCEDAQVVLASVQTEVQRLEMELDTAVREKEGLKMEMSLKEARYEANKTREETERQAGLERQMTKRLEEIHNQMSKADAEQREAHREQIKDLNKKHKEELQKQLAEFHEELKKKDAKLKQTSQEYEERMTEKHEKIASMANTRQHLENQRHNLTRRLQRMMQAHCDEAIKLLNSSAVTLSPPSTVGQGSKVHPARDVNMNDNPSLKHKTSGTSAMHTSHATQSLDSGMFSGTYLDLEGGRQKLDDVSGRSSLDFVPLQVLNDPDTTMMNSHQDTSISWQDRQFSHNPISVMDYKTKVAPDANSGNEEFSLLEQDLDYTSVTSPQSHLSSQQVSTQPADISEKLQEQEIRQSELNHYVKMLLDKSPGHPVGEEDEQQTNILLPIPRSERAEENGRSSQVISPINTQANGDFGGRVIPLQHPVLGSNSVTKDSSYQQAGHTRHPTGMSAFTKATVPSTFTYTGIGQGGLTVGPEVGPTSIQTHGRLPRTGTAKAQVPPHTPPRREQDPPAPPGALTPQQVGHLSRLLGMYNGEQALPSTDQLFAYLRGLQMNSVGPQNVSDASLQNPSTMPDTGTRGIVASERDARQNMVTVPRERAQLHPRHQQQADQLKSKNKKTTDPQLAPKQVHTHRQGPPADAHQIQAFQVPPGGPVTKPALVKQTTKQPTSVVGPPQRQAVSYENPKPPGIRGEQVSKDKKPSGKQKHSAWR